ncbi:MAG: type II toxin-antitoxin system HipA family toxin, partial [Planctomycetota bacterium]
DAAPFEDRTTRAFFGGLLPNDELRRQLARYLQVSPRNEFALLAEVGRECAGAIMLLPPDEAPTEPTGKVRVLPDFEFGQLLSELPTWPLLIGKDVRLSLAGAQDKVAVRLVDGGIALPTDGGPTIHIVKVPIAKFEHTVTNEHFCMRLAAAVGLPAPEVTMRVVAGIPILLVERFDRERGHNGRLRRLHQEDFCQALAIPPELKYQTEGGPGLPQMFDLLARHSTRAAGDRLRLLDMIVFHFLIGNADAHGKNFSWLLDTNSVRLAPVYDAICTAVYPGLSPRMAMKIGTMREFDDVRLEHWTAFAKSTGLGSPITAERLRHLADELPEHARRIQASEADADATIIDRVCAWLENRCRQVRAW